MNQAGLTLPATDPVANPNTQTNAKQLRNWISELPIANPPAVASMVQRSVSLLNRHPKPVPRRSELMSCYLPAVRHLLSVVRDNAEHPDRPGNEQTAAGFTEAVEKIVTEMAFGFKLVVTEESSFRFRRDSRQTRAASIYHAIAFLTLEMIFSFADYRREPENNWQEILHLFSLALEHDLADEPVTHQLREAVRPTSIQELLKLTSLLILLDPFHLTPGEIWAAYGYLHHWSGEAGLGFASRMQKARGLFVLNLEQGGKPVPFDAETGSQQNSDFLLLDAAPLNARINGHLQLLKADKFEELQAVHGLNLANPIGTSQMLQHMLLAWHVIPRRRHEREQKNARLTAACGIASIHRLLSRGDLPDVAPIDLHHWQLRNISAGGIEVTAPASDQRFLLVGELVLLKSEQTSGDLPTRLGVVRRLTSCREDGSLGAGIQFVYGQIFPVMVQPSGQGAKLKLNSHPALLVERGDDYPGILFTPRHVFRAMRDYTVKSESGTDLHIRSGRLLEASNSFERFEFSQP